MKITTTPLQMARTDTATARAALTVAMANTVRARALMGATAAETQRLAADEEDVVAQHGTRLHDWIAAGCDGAPPVLTLDPEASRALSTARQIERVTCDSVTVFEHAENAARVSVSRCEAHMRALHNAAMREQADLIAARIVELRGEEQDLSARLLALNIDRGNDLLSPFATTVLSDPPPRPNLESVIGGAVVADINTPIGGRVQLLDQGRRFWHAFRRQLQG